jgi:hypothetical protein
VPFVDTKEKSDSNPYEDLTDLLKRPDGRLEDLDSPISKLKAVVLSLDWDISDQTLQAYDQELAQLASTWKDDKVLVVFLQILSALGKYIRGKKSLAHPETIQVLSSVYKALEKIVLAKDMSLASQKALLVEQVARYKDLQAKISRRGKPDQQEEREAREAGPSASDAPGGGQEELLPALAGLGEQDQGQLKGSRWAEYSPVKELDGLLDDFFGGGSEVLPAKEEEQESPPEAEKQESPSESMGARLESEPQAAPSLPSATPFGREIDQTLDDFFGEDGDQGGELPSLAEEQHIGPGGDLGDDGMSGPIAAVRETSPAAAEPEIPPEPVKIEDTPLYPLKELIEGLGPGIDRAGLDQLKEQLNNVQAGCGEDVNILLLLHVMSSAGNSLKLLGANVPPEYSGLLQKIYARLEGVYLAPAAAGEPRLEQVGDVINDYVNLQNKVLQSLIRSCMKGQESLQAAHQSNKLLKLELAREKAARAKPEEESALQEQMAQQKLAASSREKAEQAKPEETAEEAPPQESVKAATSPEGIMAKLKGIFGKK